MSTEKNTQGIFPYVKIFFLLEEYVKTLTELCLYGIIENGFIHLFIHRCKGGFSWVIFCVKTKVHGKETDIRVNTATSCIIGDSLENDEEESLYFVHRRNVGDIYFLVKNNTNETPTVLTWASARSWIGRPCVNQKPEIKKTDLLNK